MKAKSSYIPILQEVSIFSALDSDSLLRLYDRCKLIEKEAEDILIQEGTDADEIYVILEGSVRIVIDRNGREFEITSFAAGDCIGEASVIGIQEHCATAIVKEKSVFLLISRALLTELFDEENKLFSMLILNIARELARRLKSTDQYLKNGL